MLVARPLHGRGLRVPASPAPIFASSQEAPKLATLYEAPDSIPTNHTAQRLPSCTYVQEGSSLFLRRLSREFLRVNVTATPASNTRTLHDSHPRCPSLCR